MRLHTVERADVRLTIYRDEEASSPRKWDNLSTMVCWHSRYRLGDEHEYATPNDFLAVVGGRDDTVILPLYLMDHSGLSLSTTPNVFRAYDPYGWDWGQVGYAYIEMSKLIREYGDLPPEELRARAVKIIQDEVKEYNMYLHGDVYGFVLEKAKVCSECNGVVSYEHIDSLWEIYGYDSIIDCLPQKYRYLLQETRQATTGDVETAVANSELVGSFTTLK